jgi:UDP-N-acetylglucosamine--N-acetylmuramyl-(pentapeptide) pyrophosphoryl-undecaprenol N-acetylglucosamine transferase
LVPLPGAIDQDQAANAKVLEKVGGAWPIRQVDLHPERLTKEINRFMTSPEMLKDAAANALSVAKPDAVKRLADLVEQVANKQGERP